MWPRAPKKHGLGKRWHTFSASHFAWLVCPQLGVNKTGLWLCRRNWVHCDTSVKPKSNFYDSLVLNNQTCNAWFQTHAIFLWALRTKMFRPNLDAVTPIGNPAEVNSQKLKWTTSTETHCSGPSGLLFSSEQWLNARLPLQRNFALKDDKNSRNKNRNLEDRVFWKVLQCCLAQSIKKLEEGM